MYTITITVFKTKNRNFLFLFLNVTKLIRHIFSKRLFNEPLQKPPSKSSLQPIVKPLYLFDICNNGYFFQFMMWITDIA